MKKILFILLSTFSFSFAFAQTPILPSPTSPNVASSSQGILVATVNITNAKIVSQNERSFVLSFYISNEIGAQSQIKYAVELTQGKTNTVIDQYVYPEVLSLSQGEMIEKTINYSIPSAISKGTYNLLIESETENGLPLGTAYAGQAIIAANAQSVVQINSCTLNASDTTATCKVTSTFPSIVTALPSFETRYGSIFGAMASTTGGSVSPITIESGTNNVSINLPETSQPQSYSVSFSLASSGGSIISNTVYFNYSTIGLKGTIQNVLFDKSSYNAGDTANLQILSSISGAASGTIMLSVLDGNNISCANPITESVPSLSFISLQVPITKNCINPQANITLSANGTILASTNFQVTTPVNQIPTANESSGALFALLAVIIIVIIIVLLRKKKNGTVILKTFIFLFIGLSALFGFTKNASANTWYWETFWGTNNPGSAGFYYYVTSPSTVTAGQPFNMTFNLQSSNNGNTAVDPLLMSLVSVNNNESNGSPHLNFGSYSFNGSAASGNVGLYYWSPQPACGGSGIYDSSNNTEPNGSNDFDYGSDCEPAQPLDGSSGNVTYTFTAPSSAGSYPVSFPLYYAAWFNSSDYNCSGNFWSGGSWCAFSTSIGPETFFDLTVNPAPVVSIQASPSSVSYNGSTTISYSAQNTSAYSVVEGDPSVLAYGTNAATSTIILNNLSTTTTFTIYATSTDGTTPVQSSVTVDVNVPPTVSISVNPYNISYGGSTVLTASSTNATSCSASSSPDIGSSWDSSTSVNPNTSNNTTIHSLLSTTTFVLSCTNSSGTTSTSTSVSVGPQAPTITAQQNSNACSEIDISWSPTANTSAYDVYRATTQTGAVNLTPSGITATNYADTGPFSTSTNYTYFVVSEENGQTAESNEVSLDYQYNASECTTQTNVGSCSLSQTGGPSNSANVYINKQMTWTLNTSLTPVSTVWSGTNIGTQTQNGSTGNVLNYIYTTVGQKTVSATVTDANGDTASCSATTTAQLNQGTNTEI